MSGPELPPYLLSVISRDLPVRRARWDTERVFGRRPPETGVWTPTPAGDRGMGLLVSVDGYGNIARAVPCDTPQGVLASDEGYLVARHNVIELWSRELAHVRDHASHPWFNDLHSLRASENGVVVAASGTDSVIEVSPAGEARWLWWGSEHGFDTDGFGRHRALNRLDDHTRRVYDTWAQATHVNSAVAPGPDAVLATLFHQGSLARIDRRTGGVRVLLDGLARPHAVRERSGVLSLADTANGFGLVCEVTGVEGPADGCRVRVDRRVDVGTAWLQDWHVLEEGLFAAVDGARPAVVFLTESGAVVRRDEFDPEWYLYEIAVDQ